MTLLQSINQSISIKLYLYTTSQQHKQDQRPSHLKQRKITADLLSVTK